MKVTQVVLHCGLALACGTANAQPDYVLHATPIGPATVDPAIARALATIKPQPNTTDDQNAGWFRYAQHIIEHGHRSAARPGD